MADCIVLSVHLTRLPLPGWPPMKTVYRRFEHCIVLGMLLQGLLKELKEQQHSVAHCTARGALFQLKSLCVHEGAS